MHCTLGTLSTSMSCLFCTNALNCWRHYKIAMCISSSVEVNIQFKALNKTSNFFQTHPFIPKRTNSQNFHPSEEHLLRTSSLYPLEYARKEEFKLFQIHYPSECLTAKRLVYGAPYKQYWETNVKGWANNNKGMSLHRKCASLCLKKGESYHILSTCCQLQETC